MKKFFKVLCLVSIVHPAWASNPFDVKIGGRMDFQSAIVKQSDGYRYSDSLPYADSAKRLRDSGFVTDTMLEMKIDRKHNKDVMYGGYITVHGDTSHATNGEQSFGDKIMVYWQSDKVGRFEVGQTPGAGGLFDMEMTNIGRGTYGIEGFWSQWLTDKTKRASAILSPFAQLSGRKEPNTRGFEFTTGPNLLSNYSGHYYSDAPKVNFFTKPHKDLTVGVAYIPDLDSGGTVSTIALRNDGPRDERFANPATYRNIISGGVLYETKVTNNLGIKLGVAAESGKSKERAVTNLRAYKVGGTLSYKDFKWAASYGDWKDSLTIRAKNPEAKHISDFYTLGFSHQIEKFGYTIGYMRSRKAGGIEPLYAKLKGMLPLQVFQDLRPNKFRNISVDVDYKLTPGFVPYAGVSLFRFKESTGSVDRGHVIMGGVRIIF